MSCPQPLACGVKNDNVTISVLEDISSLPVSSGSVSDLPYMQECNFFFKANCGAPAIKYTGGGTLRSHAIPIRVGGGTRREWGMWARGADIRCSHVRQT